MKLSTNHPFTRSELDHFNKIEDTKRRENVIETVAISEISKSLEEFMIRERYFSVYKVELPFETQYRSDLYVLTPDLYQKIVDKLVGLKSLLPEESQGVINEVIHSINTEK